MIQIPKAELKINNNFALKLFCLEIIKQIENDFMAQQKTKSECLISENKRKHDVLANDALSYNRCN